MQSQMRLQKRAEVRQGQNTGEAERGRLWHIERDRSSSKALGKGSEVKVQHSACCFSPKRGASVSRRVRECLVRQHERLEDGLI